MFDNDVGLDLGRTVGTLAVLEAAGRGGVEVAAGAAAPLGREHVPFPVVHGERGLGRGDPPEPRLGPSDRTAADAIVATARERPGEVMLVATGPLTNVALALREEPHLPDLLRGFALMGGAFARGCERRAKAPNRDRLRWSHAQLQA